MMSASRPPLRIRIAQTFAVAFAATASACSEPEPAAAPPPLPPPDPAAVPVSPAPRPDASTGFANSFGMKFVRIPAGNFVMGCSGRGADFGKDERAHVVRISKAFHMAVVPVTNAEYRRFRPMHDSGGYRGHSLNADNQPVVKVSWNDANALCEWLNAVPAERAAGRRYRLPTEAEWEYACRAGTNTAYNWGDEFRPSAANFADVRTRELFLDWADASADDGYAVTSPVGSFPANRWGLLDMHGNVWQWCSDRWGHDYPEGENIDPTGPTYGGTRVLRGGSWYARAGMCRASARVAFSPDERRPYFGIRLVCEKD